MASADTTSSRTAAAKAHKPAKRAATSKRPATPTASSTTSSYAERAVLIPVGAALIARDKVVSGVNDTITSYSSTSKAQAQLRKFEHRGVTARKRVEREVRKARTSVERELRKRRQDSAELADRLQGRIQSLV
ncbi:MAG TPA: hypothetical protein VJ996_01875 [Solirubrobacteraceae bacterium]|jgi:hypothetical protein|nr:hypothetical protein [Solirubrobacteraceae bacterium]